MIPGTELIICCPHCQAAYQRPSLRLARSTVAELWSDGKAVVPADPSPPELSRCSACGSFFWIEDSEVVGRRSWGGEDAVRGRAQAPVRAPVAALRRPRPEDLEEALELGAAFNESQEMRLRLWVWWARNDAVRTAAGGDLDGDPGLLEPFLALVHSEPEWVLLRAEALRALGRFEEAVLVLGELTGEWVWAGPQLAALARSRSRLLARIEPPAASRVLWRVRLPTALEHRRRPSLHLGSHLPGAGTAHGS